jgi:hypothetical protein
MQFITPYIQTIRTIFIISGIVLAIWFYKDWQFQTAENKKQSENMHQLRVADSTHYAQQLLSKDEISEYLKYQNKDLKNKLESNNIKLNRIESIVSQSYKYRDTTKRETDLSGLVDAIRKNIPTTQEVIDTTKCMTIKGIVSFENNKLKFTVTDRQFNNKSNAVAYWERRQWNFLGIKTRLLGKKQFTSKVFDECGESQIMRIEKKK